MTPITKTTMSHRSVSLFSLLVVAASSLSAQQPAATPAATPPAVERGAPDQAKPTEPAAAGQKPADSSGAYSYDPQGRRDPFVSLVARGNEGRSTAGRPAGPAGLMIGEVSVKGIIRDRSGFIAMVQGADTRSYTIRSGEKLMDGTVKAITADSVVFSQDVNDFLSLVKQKEVRKTVRAADGGRG
jgi:hypothetical protein